MFTFKEVPETKIRELIKKELEQKRASGYIKLSEDYAGLRRYLLFYSDCDNWFNELQQISDKFIEDLKKADLKKQQDILLELSYLQIDLSSMSISWFLEKHVDSNTIEKGSDYVAQCIADGMEIAPKASKKLHEWLIERTIKRYGAESVPEAEKEELAKTDCGKDLSEYTENMIDHCGASNFGKIARLMMTSPEKTILGNDFGDFLQETLWLGSSFATTNPPLANAAWDLEKGYWEAKLAEFLSNEKELLDQAPSWMTEEQRAACIATMLIVESNCIKLRDIFLAKNGETGYCCYQVNPKNLFSSERMLDEVHYVYGMLKKRLGEVPNVSFKLPGVPSALATAEVLAKEGICMTITLEYGLFQALPFARIFAHSTSVISNLVVMNGRIAFPVKDELIENNIENGEEASKMVGVEITRHLYNALYSSKEEGGIGTTPSKVKIMNASLRNYGSDIPDLTEIWGSPLITIFPNARRCLDSVLRENKIDTIHCKTPVDTIKVLMESELFRQAYWCETDPKCNMPTEYIPFNLENENRICEWKAVSATLNQFLGAYDGMIERVSTVLEKVK